MSRQWAAHESARRRRLSCSTRILLGASQCLDRRLPDLAAVSPEVAAWETRRNRERPTANWQFTTAKARIKLRKLYPTVEG